VIGLAGSHRVGKTTLARDYAERYGFTFLETSVSGIFKELGYDPADTFDFSTRLSIQEQVLSKVDAMYGAADHRDLLITDRTPIDMLAYTLAEANGNLVSESDQGRLESYMQRCFSVVNRRFSSLILVQPGIPIVSAEGKAAPNKAYIEHLNSLMLGLMMDERVKVTNFYIRRSFVGREERIKVLDFAIDKHHRMASDQLDKHLSQGMLVQ
jgi:predicted ATPase